MFSYAIIIWELAHWNVAFDNLDIFEIKDLIRAGDLLPIHEAIPKSFESIIETGWDQDQLIPIKFCKRVDSLGWIKAQFRRTKKL